MAMKKARRSFAPAGKQAQNVRSSKTKVFGPVRPVYFHSPICVKGSTSSPVSSAHMHRPVKLLLTAAVALLLLGDAVPMTAATTTTSNASLRAAVDTRNSEEPGSVQVNPKFDEERGITSFISWIRSWGSVGRSSSVKKPPTMKSDKVASAMKNHNAMQTQKVEVDARAKMLKASGISNDDNRDLPAYFKRISEKGGEEERATLFKAWIGGGEKKSKLVRELWPMLKKVGVNDDVVAKLMGQYQKSIVDVFPLKAK